MRNNNTIRHLLLPVALLLLTAVGRASNEPVRLTLVYGNKQPVTFELSSQPVVTYTPTALVVSCDGQQVTAPYADLTRVELSQGSIQNYIPSKGTTGGGTQNINVVAEQRPQLPVPEIPTVSISGATVEFSTNSLTYNGYANKPIPIVKVNGRVLTLNTDFTVSYANNTDPGTASVTVTGINGYSGTVQGSFNIFLKPRIEVSINGEKVTPAVGDLNKVQAKATFETSSGTIEVSNYYALPLETVTITVTPKGKYEIAKSDIEPALTGEDPAKLGDARTYTYRIPLGDENVVAFKAVFTENKVPVSIQNLSATDQPVVMSIYDAAGRLVSTETVAAGSEVSISLDHLPAGTYIIRVNNQTFKVQKK